MNSGSQGNVNAEGKADWSAFGVFSTVMIRHRIH